MNFNKLNELNFYFTFLTNFKPVQINFSKNFFFTKNTSNRLICKNFFLFLFLLKYLNKKVFYKNSLIVKPIKQKLFTLMRAPYHFKISRHQITISRYILLFKLNFKLNNSLIFYNTSNLIYFINFFKNFNV